MFLKSDDCLWREFVSGIKTLHMNHFSGSAFKKKNFENNILKQSRFNEQTVRMFGVVFPVLSYAFNFQQKLPGFLFLPGSLLTECYYFPGLSFLTAAPACHISDSRSSLSSASRPCR